MEVKSNVLVATELTKIVFNESKEQYHKAEAVLHKYDQEQVQKVVSHKFCLILLNCGVAHL